MSSTDGSLRITDYTLTDRGRAWLTGRLTDRGERPQHRSSRGCCDARDEVSHPPIRPSVLLLPAAPASSVAHRPHPRTEPTFPSSRRLIGLNIPLHEARALAEEYELPPIITLDEAAKVARRSPFTVKRLVSEGGSRSRPSPVSPLLFSPRSVHPELMKEHG